MGAFLFTLIAGAAAGVFTARIVARREVDALRAQLAQCKPEPAHAPSPSAVTAPPPVAVPPPPVRETEPAISDEITPEILMVLSAAVAAFLGKKAKIRRARVAGPAHQGSAWAQQGRVFVQASHNLPHHY